MPCPISSCGTATVTTPSETDLDPGVEGVFVLARPPAAAGSGAGVSGKATSSPPAPAPRSAFPRRESRMTRRPPLWLSSQVATRRAMAANASACGVSPAAGGVPASLSWRIARSSGIRPRNGKAQLFAAASAPPEPNGSLDLRRNAGRHSRPCSRPSRSPAPRPDLEQLDRAARVDQRKVLRGGDDHRARRLVRWSMVSCTSPVPGGRSTTSVRSSPQSASISWPSALPAIGPRQAIALSRFDQGGPSTASARPSWLGTGTSFLSRASGGALRCPAGAAARGHRYRHRPARPCGPSAPARRRDWRRQVDLPTPPLPDPTAMIRRRTLSAISATRTSLTPGCTAQRVLHRRFPAARAPARRARRRRAPRRRAAIGQPQRLQPRLRQRRQCRLQPFRHACPLHSPAIAPSVPSCSRCPLARKKRGEALFLCARRSYSAWHESKRQVRRSPGCWR
jgi:hypothetical protein